MSDWPKAVPHLRPSGLKVLFVSSECAPFAKVGGLADVVSALPRVLRRLGHDVRVLLPLYGTIDRKRYGIVPSGSACVHTGHGEVWVGVHHAEAQGGVPLLFVEHQGLFGRPGIYDDSSGAYSDNGYRYTLLCKAALQICKDQHFLPDVVHAHDWPTSLCTALLATTERVHSPLSRTASVLTIHNIGYQGHFDRDVFSYSGIGQECFRSDVFEDHGGVNLLKGGIALADAVTTVSPSYSREILRKEGGHGLHEYLQRRAGDFFGILNGADYDQWDPRRDHHLPAHFGPGDLAGKDECKRALQAHFGLHLAPDVPIFGVVTRFAQQKGINLLMGALPWALSTMRIQVVVLGNGDAESERFFTWLASHHRGRAAAYVGYSEKLSHLIQAGSDFFLMPSLYEPCGLTQMYALRYGTLPVVRATGGLDDTVQNYDESSGEGTGFKFHDPKPEALYDTIGWAVSTYYDRAPHFQQLRRQAMAEEFSWQQAATHYLAAYDHALIRHRHSH